MLGMFNLWGKNLQSLQPFTQFPPQFPMVKNPITQHVSKTCGVNTLPLTPSNLLHLGFQSSKLQIPLQTIHFFQFHLRCFFYKFISREYESSSSSHVRCGQSRRLDFRFQSGNRETAAFVWKKHDFGPPRKVSQSGRDDLHSAKLMWQWKIRNNASSNGTVSSHSC